MKTKTSKKVLSFILAVMMLVTSIPMLGFVALADEAAATDSAVVEVQDAMDAFETKLSSAGAFTNVVAAYNAYVDCQKALDAYIYGGESNALAGKASALNTAIGNIGTFTPKTASAIPTFANSSASDMKNYAGEGFGNILYSSTAESIGSAYAGQAGFQIIMSKDITVLYDGSNDILIPVMLDAYKSNNATPDVESSTNTAYSKTRYFYAAYPSTAADGSTDDTNFNLVGYWQSGGGADANWNWNWWSGVYNGAGTNYDPAYSMATGYASGAKQQTDYRTAGSDGKGMVVNRTGGITSRRYTSVEYYHSNVLKYVGGEITGASKKATIYYWYGSSGDSANSSADDKNISGTMVNIVNYKYLTDALTANGNKMKAIAMSEFSEGGLSDYVAAMEAGANFDPASYFTSSNDFSGCVAAMNTVVDNMNNASVTNTNSADYQDLRTAMSDAVRNTYKAGNTGYTDDSWDAFAAKYQAAQAIMADTNDSGYTSTLAATAAVELLEAYNGLQTNVVKVDTTALSNAIDTFEAYNKNNFTTDSYAAAQAVVKAAKEAVWGAEDNYMVPTEAPDDSVESEALVANQTQAVLDAIKALRISADAVVAIDSGDRYSLNTAYALAATVTNTTDYSNYASLATAVNNAKAYEKTLSSKELTDLDAQLEEYKTYVNAIVVAFENLQYSFTKLPDGTVTGTAYNAITTLENHKNSNGYNYYTDFSYPGSAIIFKTTHDANTVAYGNANLTWRINIDNNIGKENNAIDSITINGTADNANINSTSPTSTPNALSDDQKATYAGCLANNGFSLTNFRVTDSINNSKTSYGTTATGAAVTERVSATDEFTKILATTEGSGNNPALGAIPLQPIVKGDASITLTSDMNVDIPATTKKTLTGSTYPTKTNYSYTGYFGITYIWNTQPTLAYAGYDYNTSKVNNESINSVVSVIDMSNLVDLVDQCNALLPESAKYTDETWAKLLTALEAAQADLNYTGMTADSILTNVKSRYTQLWAAYSALAVKEFTVTFSYKNSAGIDTSKVITVEYGDTLSMSKYTTQINSIITPDYVANNYTYTFNDWTPAVDLDAEITSDMTFVAVYDGTPNEATWDAFNTARAELLGAIQPKTYTAADLEALNIEIEALSYFYYTDEQKAATMADKQDEIDSQAAAMVELKNNLTPANIDVDAATAAGGDQDRYSSEVNPYTVVTVAGEAVTAFTYATQAELDEALNASLAVRTYTIYVNGAAVTTADYGTPMLVNSDNSFEKNVSDITSSSFSGANVAWFYSYAAPSNNYVQTARKYMTKAPSFGFIVKGDTYLTTTDENDESIDGLVVTMVANLADTSLKTYAICYTDGDGILQDAPATPSYAYYRFVGYTCDGASLSETEDGRLQVDDTCTIIANYEVDTTYSNGFAINVYLAEDPSFVLNSDDGLGTDWETADGFVVKNLYDYNEKVEFITEEGFWLAEASMDDVYALYTAEDPEDYSTYQLLCMGGDYTFYAYADLNIVACSSQFIADNFASTYKPSATVTANSTAVPVYDNAGDLAKISLVGTFALPEGYSMIESGFLFTSNTTVADITVDKVGTNGIARMKSSRYTVGNQFVINVLMPEDGTDYDYKYVAYTIVKDASGNVSTHYSNAYTGSTSDF